MCRSWDPREDPGWTVCSEDADSVKEGWEVRAPFRAFLGKAATEESKTQQRSSTDWIMVSQQKQPCWKEAMLRLGSVERKDTKTGQK